MTDESLAEQARAARSEVIATAIEAVALRRFAADGFGTVTVETIAREVGISVRTFYRYFPAKEDVLQLRIERRTDALAAALAARPAGEPPLEAVRRALVAAVAHEDPASLRRWTDVISTAPGLIRGVLGGIALKSNRVLAEFLGLRLGQPATALVPTMLAAAIGGVIQAAQTQWYLEGGDLGDRLSAGLAVLETRFAEPG